MAVPMGELYPALSVFRLGHLGDAENEWVVRRARPTWPAPHDRDQRLRSVAGGVETLAPGIAGTTADDSDTRARRITFALDVPWRAGVVA